MKPLAVVAALVIVAVASAFVLLTGGERRVTVSGAALVPMGPGHAVTFEIDNPGPPDRLLSVRVGDAADGVLPDAPLTIPGGDTAALAMDGIHAMATGLDVEAEQLVPLTAVFERSGEVQARARVGAGAPMDHGALYDVPRDEPMPTVALTLRRSETEGWDIDILVTNFMFSRDAVDGPHQPGIGHGHLYLDGLKLGRIYGAMEHIGPLPEGSYELRVTLNTNDHRAYARDGVPVSAAVRIEVPATAAGD